MQNSVYPPLLFTFDPVVATQITAKYYWPKSQQLEKALMPIMGGPSMITMNGNEWKHWRGLLNPGFSSSSMMNNMFSVIGAVEAFCAKL